MLPRQAELHYEELLVRIASLSKLNYGDVKINNAPSALPIRCIISTVKLFVLMCIHMPWPAGTDVCVRLFSRKNGLTSNFVAENRPQ